MEQLNEYAVQSEWVDVFRSYVLIMIGCMVFLGLVWLIAQYRQLRRKLKYRKRVRELSRHAEVLRAEEFLALRKKRAGGQGGPLLMNQYAFPGVYILYNTRKKKYYVGQAKNVCTRVNNHLTGKGNGDVYADFKYGDPFDVQLIPLKDSGFRSLNDLERYAIERYHAKTEGYNKTKGNR